MTPLAVLVAVACALVFGGPQLRQMAADASEAIAQREPGFTRPAVKPTRSLAELVVDDSPDAPDYDRDRFGPAWADIDHNGCDQRNDTLSAYLADVQYRAGTHDCVVETGTFTDPYTGEIRPFVKSQAGGGVDIDHLVPLEQAWRSGAWAWTDEQRAAYANDLTLLVPTDASLNRSKGSQDVTTWLPPAEGGYVCTYLERWVTVKTTWDLTVTTDELAALSAGLADCED
jgi:hypothetical protein